MFRSQRQALTETEVEDALCRGAGEASYRKR